MSILGYSELRAQYRTGIFRVALELLAALSSQPGVTLGAYTSSGNDLLCRRALRRAGIPIRMTGGSWLAHLSFLFLVLRNGSYKAGLHRSSRILGRMLTATLGWRAKALKKGQVWDVYLSPMDAIPDSLRSIPGLSFATVIHDLIPLRLPEYSQGTDDPTRWFSRLVSTIRPTDLLFAVSEFTRKDFLASFPDFPPDRIAVAYNAVDGGRFFPLKRERDAFFLAVSTVEPRKRLDAVFEGYRLYRRNGGKNPLVVCGTNRSGHLDRLLRDFDEADKTFVSITGYLPDGALPVLYATCRGFLSLSEYEGFGLPILEAMSCGAPVVVSDRTSHPEVAGEAGIYVDPDTPATVAEALRLLDDDSGLRNDRTTLSLAQARRFSWDGTARSLLSRLREERKRGGG